MNTSSFRFLFLLFAVYPAIALVAQPDGKFDEWGKVTIDELKMSDCSFYPGAEAMLLMDLGEVYYTLDHDFFSGTFFAHTAHYRRYKIFSKEGMSVADFKLNFNPDAKEKITNIQVASYTLKDGKMVKTVLDPDQIHTTKIVTGLSQLAFAVPAVAESSVFEVTYEREERVDYNLPTWTFTKTLPTALSSVTIGFIDALDYYIDRHIVKGPLAETSKDFTSDIYLSAYGGLGRTLLPGHAITYTEHDISPYRAEPHTNSIRNYTDWIGFQLRAYKDPLDLPQRRGSLMTSFGKFASSILNGQLFSDNLTSDGIPKKEWKNLITESMTDLDKAKAIFEFVRSNIKWNHVTSYRPSYENSSIWKNKIGSKAEINLLLINTLRKAGLNAYPMVVGSRSGGYINKTYPILDDFHGLDALLMIGSDEIVLDATNRLLPFGLADYDQLNTLGLVIKSREDISWHRVKDEQGASTHTFINAQMDLGGAIKGDITYVADNYIGDNYLADMNDPKKPSINDHIKRNMPNISIESVTDSADIPHCHFIEHVRFNTQAISDRDGHLYISLPAIYGDMTNRFTAPHRVADIDLGYRRSADVTLCLALPDAYMVDSLFPPISVGLADTSAIFRSDAQSLGQTVIIRHRIELRKAFYKATEYPEFYEFEKKYYALRQQPIVLKKKP